jgi:hypothetical protein
MNRKDLDALNELYLSVYSGEQLNENAYSDLIKRGYSPSAANQMVQRNKNVEARGGGLGQIGAGMIRLIGSKEARKQLKDTDTADRRREQTALKRTNDPNWKPGQPPGQKPPEKKPPTGIAPVTQPAGSPPSRPAPPKPSGPVLSKKNGVEGTGVGANFKPRAFSSAEKSRYASVAAKNAASSGAPKPATPAIGKLGNTSFERRTPTSAELRASQKERAGGASPEKALQAAKLAGQTQKSNDILASGKVAALGNKSTVQGTQQQVKADNIVKSGAVAALKPTPPTPGSGALKNAVATATAKPLDNNFKPINKDKPIKEMSSYEWPSAKTIRDIAGAYSSIYEAKKKVDQDQDGDNDFADVRVARMIASGVPKAKAIAMVKDKSYNEEVEIDEATAMAKKGYDETEIRNKIAKSTGGGKFADKATELENRPTFGDKSKQAAREKLARMQRGDFRRTTSSDYGLRLGAHKSNDPAVKAKQAARGKQISALTPKEKKMLNREAYAAYEFVASYLLENNFANTIDDANVIINNMSEGWFESIMEEKKSLPVSKMKNKESKLLDNEEGQLQALRTDVGSKERKARMKELQRFDNINSVRTSVAKRGGKQQHSMPEVGRYKPKDED